MEFKNRTVKKTDMICGNFDKETSFFKYRSSSYPDGVFSGPPPRVSGPFPNSPARETHAC